MEGGNLAKSQPPEIQNNLSIDIGKINDVEGLSNFDGLRPLSNPPKSGTSTFVNVVPVSASGSHQFKSN